MIGVLYQKNGTFRLLDQINGETAIQNHAHIGFWTIRRLLNLAKAKQITTLWIASGNDFSNDLQRSNENRSWPQFWDWTGWTVKPEPKKSILEGERLKRNVITGWDEDGFRCKVIFAGLAGADWRFDEISSPYELFNSIMEFRNTLGVIPTFKLESSRSLFESTLPKKLAAVSENNSEYWKPFIEKIESDFIYLREPSKAEKKKKYVHAFDKRSMYLTAARGVQVGIGGYELAEKIKYADLGKDAAGLFEISKPKFTDPLLADLFGQERSFYKPMLDLFNEDDPPKIKRGYIFPETRRIFEKYASILLDAIKQTRGAEEESLQSANAAYKSLYTGFFGWLGRVDNRDGWKAELFRPDWRGAVISLANANLLRNVRQVAKWTNGNIPFGIYHDCLMYFSDASDPVLEFNGSDVCQANKFSHEWTLPASIVLKEIKSGGTVLSIDKLGKDAPA